MSLYNPTYENDCDKNKYKNYSLEIFNGNNIKEEENKISFVEYFDKKEYQEKIFEYYPSDGTDKAEIIIEKARAEAEGIIKKAKNNIDVIEQEAYKKGYIQGEKDGKEIGIKKIDKVLENFDGLIEDIKNYRYAFQINYESETIKLICKIAEKIVKTTTEIDSNIVKESIIGALNIASEKTKIKVRVNPSEIEYIKDLRPQYFEKTKELKSMSIESDPNVEKGGCILETSYGHIDACIESQLEQISKAVKDAYKNTKINKIDKEIK